MRNTLQWLAIGCAVVAVVCAGMLWVTLGPEVKAEANRAAAARGWQPVFVEQQQVLHDFDGVEFNVPKTAVPGSSLSASFVFRHLIWPGMDALDLYQFEQLNVSMPVAGIVIEGRGDDGQYGFIVTEGAEVTKEFWYDLPVAGTEMVEIPISVAMTGTTGMNSTVTHNPIGEKGATHAKEHKFADEWFIPAGTTVQLTIGGETFEYDTVGDLTAALSIGISGIGIDADDWYGYTSGAKYVMEIADITFGDVAIDTSSYTATTWGCAAGANKLWAEGTGSGIGFWAAEDFYCGAYVYCDYPGVTINAPFSYDFSPMEFKLLDGTDIPDTVELYCTGFRNLSVGGVDIGPWKGTIAALRARGRYTQQHGCYSWDTWDPDMQAQVEIYLSLASAEAHGLQVRSSQPAYKVEGAGYAEVPPTPSPVDGQYAPAGTYNGETMFSNGLYYLYCTDAAGPDWGIGPGPGSDPYYTQDGGGPAGSYVANTDSYGAVYLGDAPSVSADTGEAISVDSDLATPGFDHDGTVIFDCWPLSAVNRTDAPYMTNVCTLMADGEKDIYANAHTHEHWVGTNVSTPTAGGVFTVGAGGGTIDLTLACNYPARLAAVGAVGAIPVPTAYQTRRHDALIGTGNPVEKPEAVWDWRGKYFLQSFKDLTLPCDLKYRLTYFNGLHGCSDNHLSDSTRQTTFSYNPGPAYTLERTIRVTYADGSGWSPVLIDLYDEQNGHPVARVESIEWEFPDAGTYEMSKPTLPPGDPGDRQELVAAAPGYREAPSSSGAYVKIDEHWQYAQGVVSGHVNGLCDRVLFMPDHVKPCTVEHCFDTLNVVIGAGTGTDLTTCYSLGGWPINNAGEAWGYTYSSGAEESHMKDSDGAVLKTLAVSDIRPEYQLAAVGDVITPSVAVRAYSITCVPGLAYTFYGRKIFNGRGHGMLLRPAQHAYPRARNMVGGDLARRHLGSSDPWQVVELSLTSDEHGHWGSAAWEITDTDAARTLWEYGSRGDHMGRFATREFALIELFRLSAGSKRCGVYTDPDGVTWYAWIESTDIKVAYMQAEYTTFSTPITVDSSGDYDAVDMHGDGRLLVVGARNSSDEKMYSFHSLNMGDSWSGPHLVG